MTLPPPPTATVGLLTNKSLAGQPNTNQLTNPKNPETTIMKNQSSTKSILMLALMAGILSQPAAAQNGADPYSRNANAANAGERPQNPGDDSVIISCTFEVFTLPLELAAAWQREQIDDGELYKRLIEGLKTGTTRQEILNVTRTAKDRKTTNESVFEYIYPTEYESESFKGSIGLVSPTHPKKNEDSEEAPSSASVETAPVANAMQVVNLEGLHSPALPTAFQTRNLGETFEIEPTLAENSVKLQMVFEQNVHVGDTRHGQGISQVTMPEIESRRFNTQLTVPIGKPTLAGTFNRATISKADPESSSRTSYAFVTATLARP